MTPEPLWEITYEFDGATAVLPQSAVEMMLRGDVSCPACRARLIYVPMRMRIARLAKRVRESKLVRDWIRRMRTRH